MTADELRQMTTNLHRISSELRDGKPLDQTKRDNWARQLESARRQLEIARPVT